MSSAPRPQPSALAMSCSSLFPPIFSELACSALSTLPRNGRIACVLRSRPCLAEPPAESPSTMNSSLSSGSVEAQSASLPGRLSLWLIADFRVTACAARDASLARAARMMRATTASAIVLLSLSHFSTAGRMTLSIWPCVSGLLSRSLVCPWNCGSTTYAESTHTMPSRMSSAVRVTPLGVRSCVSM